LCQSDLYLLKDRKYNIEILSAMEYIVAQKLRDSWENKPCDHPHFEKEFYAGAYLVNYVCTHCGKEFTIADKMELDESRKKSSLKIN